jgi:hypothetical protein
MKFIFVISYVLADVRLSNKEERKGINGTALEFFREPDTFGYAGIEKQKKNNYDQFLRSNIDNEANKRNAATEEARDMLPCRQDQKGTIQTLKRGETTTVRLRWNNPHDSECELNAFVNGMQQVAPVKRPQPCGGGFKDQEFSFAIPSDFEGCDQESDSCVLQMYAHSVEPRTYAFCTDFVLTGDKVAKRQLPSGELAFALQPAIHYADSFDTAHVDSKYSGYRGQQAAFISNELKAAIKLQSFVPNGGLVPLGNINKEANAKLRAEIQNAIKENEKKARALNKAAQREFVSAFRRNNVQNTGLSCFEGELYGVVNNANCVRLYTNTYVTNVGYSDILNRFATKLQGLPQYEPKLKNLIGETPKDPFGSFKGPGGQPSLVPRGQPAPNEQVQKPFELKVGEPPQIAALASNSPPAPLPAFIKNLAKSADAREGIEANPDDAIAAENIGEIEARPKSSFQKCKV